MPVTLPPGRLMLDTRPTLTGSSSQRRRRELSLLRSWLLKPTPCRHPLRSRPHDGGPDQRPDLAVDHIGLLPSGTRSQGFCLPHRPLRLARAGMRRATERLAQPLRAIMRRACSLPRREPWTRKDVWRQLASAAGFHFSQHFVPIERRVRCRSTRPSSGAGHERRF